MVETTRRPTMFNIEFTISGNPDRCQSEFWEERINISAPTMKELREKVLKFQYDNDIGGGNWGEATLHQDGNLVGFVSYNLRVWAKPYWHTGSEEVKI
jgi:hypothetical protein